MVRSLFGARAEQAGIPLRTVKAKQEDVREVVSNLTDHRGADDVIVAVGSAGAIGAAMGYIGRGAVLNLFGGLQKGQEMAGPTDAADRARLVEAIALAEEIGTAVPGVGCYCGPGPASLCSIPAAGLRLKAAMGGPRAVICAAENHNHAAEFLKAAVMEEIPGHERFAIRARVRFLNTVIGKMSGVMADADVILDRQMAPMAPGYPRAFLVEAFNRILISQIRFGVASGEPPFQSTMLRPNNGSLNRRHGPR